jgi:outer membrane receptor protein involved in Fe transport
VITKRGDPEYHGDLRFLFRDFRMDARNAFAVERAPEQRRIFEGSLAGPIGNSKEYFFVVSAESQQDDLWSPVYALAPSGLVQEQAFQPQRENEFSIRVERRPESGSSMSLRYEREKERRNGIGIGGFRLPETASDAIQTSDRLQFSHQSFWTPSMGNNLVVRLRNGSDEQISRLRGVPRIVVVDAFTSGGAQADRLEREQRLELANVVSWSSNKHYIRAGVNVHEIGRSRYDDRTDRDGTFYFSSLDEYLLGRPFSFTRQTGDGRAAFWRASGGAFIQDDIKLRPNLTLAAGIRYDTQNWLRDRNNFSPRLSVAYAAGKERKTVIRAGAGLFYDRLGGGAPLDLLLYGGGGLFQNVVPFPSYPDPFGNGAGETLPASLVRFADNLRAPYMLLYMANVERQIRPRMTLSIGYSGVRGVKQFRSVDLNAPLGPGFERPNPAIATLRQLESTGRMVRHALNISLRGRITQYFDGAVMYNLGRTWNHANGSGALPANSYDLSGEWARANYDRRHRFRALGSFKVADLFTLGTVVRIESGAPYSLTTGLDLNRDGSAIDRPAGVGRNTLEGPGAATVDLRLSKQFALPSEKRETPPRITVAADAFNVFNTVNYSGFVGNMSSPFFGLPVSSRPARRVQLMLRFSF